MLVLETLEQAVKATKQSITQNTEAESLERFRSKKRAYKWDRPAIKGS